MEVVKEEAATVSKTADVLRSNSLEGISPAFDNYVTLDNSVGDIRGTGRSASTAAASDYTDIDEPVINPTYVSTTGEHPNGDFIEILEGSESDVMERVRSGTENPAFKTDEEQKGDAFFAVVDAAMKKDKKDKQTDKSPPVDSDTEAREIEEEIQKMVEAQKEMDKPGTSRPLEPAQHEKKTTEVKKEDSKEKKTNKFRASVQNHMSSMMMMCDPDQQVAAMFKDKDGDNDKPAEYTNYLRLAVRHDSPQLVERLLSRSSALNIYHALLFSINIGRDHITMIFLEHAKYETVRQVTKLTKLGTLHTHTTEIEEAEENLPDDADDTVFSADVTPLMLAAQRNQFEVVQALLSKGELIEEQHSSSCKCGSCSQQQLDELRQAKTKLTTYRALASDSYVVLANSDPVFTAFELGQKLKKLSIEDKHFKAEYLQLSEQCGDLSGRLLDRVRDGDELDTMLNEKSGSGLSAYDNLARLKLAVHHKEKKFVAHATCQKKLASLWMGSLNPHWVSSPARVLLFLLCLTIVYPFLAILYWIYPWNRVGRFMSIPWVKFSAATCSYIIFISLVIGYSATEEPSSGYRLSMYPGIAPLYNAYSNSTDAPFISDVFVRFNTIGAGTIVLGIWLLGLIWDNIKKINSERFMYFTHNIYNVLDFIMLCLFIISFCLRFAAVARVRSSVAYFKQPESWQLLQQNMTEATEKTYWLIADRSHWDPWDPALIGESIFSIASLISICKLTYVFTISERIGPLLISLAKMIEDMFAFMVIFVFIIVAFVIGFHNLFWYFYGSAQAQIGIEEGHKTFGSLSAIVQNCFWSIFGLFEMEDGMFETHTNGYVTSITGHVMFAIYNWMMVIILINMLIAMMSRSYEFIATLEDIEWKFARTKLFLEYIKEGSTMPPPFNLVPTWKGLYLLCKKMSNSWCPRCAGRPPRGRKPHGSMKPGSRKSKSSSDLTPDSHVDQSNMYYSPNLNGKPGTTLNLASRGGVNMPSMTGDKNTGKPVKSKKTYGREPSEEYKRVISQVVKRFIQQYGKTKQAADISQDLDQIKRDMSTLRQEMMTNLYRQEKEQATLMKNVRQLDAGMLESRDLFTIQHRELKADHDAKIEEVESEIEVLDKQVKGLKNSFVDSMNEFQRQLNAQHREMRIGMEILKDGMYRLCADVTALRGGDSVSREVLIRQEAPAYLDINEGSVHHEVGARFFGDQGLGSVPRPDPRTYSDYRPISVKARRVLIDK